MPTLCYTVNPFPFAPYVFATEETTVDDLRRYLRDIRACGFTAVRFGAGEDGYGAKHLAEDRYDFRHTNPIFDLADKAGLQLIPNLRAARWRPLVIPADVDVLECDRFGGRMWIVAAIHPPDAIRKILDCLGLPSRRPSVAPAFHDLDVDGA